MNFKLNLGCFVLSMDSSACLGNNILPGIYGQILHLPKQMIKKALVCLSNITALQIFKAGRKYGTLKAN